MNQITLKSRWLVAGLAWAAFWPCLQVGFVWDDHWFIERAAAVDPLSREVISRDFSSGVFRSKDGFDFYRPLQILAHRVTFAIAGNRPGVFHAVNVGFHSLNAVLLMELLVVCGLSAGAAWMAGAIFAVHPIIVSELIMASGLSEVLGFTAVLAVLVSLRRHGRWAWIGAPAFFVLGLLTKESALIVPVLAFLLAWALDDRKMIRPASILVGIACLYFVWYRHVVPLAWSSHLGTDLLRAFMLQAYPGILLHYLGLLLWPWPLYSDRFVISFANHWKECLAIWGMLAAVLTLKRSRGAWAWALGLWMVFLPKAPLMVLQSRMLDHWAYPALPVLLVPMAWLCWKGVRSSSTAWRAVSWSLFSVIIVGLMFDAHLNVRLRGTDAGLYGWALRYETSPLMRANLDALKGQMER